MKTATLLNDTKDYLYTSLVLPMKKIQFNNRSESPIRNRHGNKVYVSWVKEERKEHGNRNYQRRRAERDRNDILIARIQDGGIYALGSCDRKTHMVRLYSERFKGLELRFLLGLIERELSANTPFTKIIIDDSNGYNGLRIDSDSIPYIY